MKIDFQENAENYLLGNMSSTKAAEFEALLKDDKELQEEFLIISAINKHYLGDTSIEETPQNEYTKKLRSVIQSDDALKIKNDIVKAQNSYKKERKSWNPYFFRIAASIAFILLFSVGAYYFLNSEEKNLYASFYSPTDLPSVISRGSDENIISKAIIAFQKKDYKESLDLLESSEAAKNNNEVAILLHYGIIYLENGNLNAALGKFNKVIELNSIDNSKGYWFKALAYLKAEDFEKARLILQTISENPDYFKHTEAKELLLQVSK